MPNPERPDERAMVEQDKRNLERALAKVRKQKKKSAGDRQIEAQLEEMAGTQDLDDPQRYHGS
ncbi:MAG: hypothetical protein ACJ8FU_15570 [Xanthobacteraceae bacterium]|jgi:CRISPR/Cas system-associated endonuclease Cas1